MNNTLEKKILFIFNEGREQKLQNIEFYAKDFFYHYLDLKNENYDVDYIQISELNHDFNNWAIKFIEKLVRKITNIPFYHTKLLSKKNITKINDAEIIVFTNETTIFSLFFYLFFNKLKNKEKIAFLMGITQLDGNKFRNFIKDALIRTIFSRLDKIIFLSKGELKKAKTIYFENINKFKHLPFAIDSDFWTSEDFKLNKNNEILFIGNDKNRDFEIVKDLIKILPEYKFTVVSKNNIFSKLKANNIKHISGEWRLDKVTDLEILKIYFKAKICILPIKPTSQPSGQSVASQAMSIGVPVIITKTEGFWEPDLFIDKENIFFVESNSLESWKDIIENVYQEEALLNFVSQNAKKIIINKYSQNIVFEEFKSLLLM